MTLCRTGRMYNGGRILSGPYPCKRISATYAGRMLCSIFAYAADMRYMKISFNRGV